MVRSSLLFLILFNLIVDLLVKTQGIKGNEE